MKHYSSARKNTKNVKQGKLGKPYPESLDQVVGRAEQFPSKGQALTVNEVKARLKPTDFYRPNNMPDKIPRFYLIANDRECFQRLNDILNQDGYFPVSVGNGEYKYYVDMRKSPYHAKKVIYDLLKEDLVRRNDDEVQASIRNKAIDMVLRAHGFKFHHLGTQYISYALKTYPKRPDRYQPLCKNYYPKIAEHFDATVRKVERAINYSLESVFDSGRNLYLLCELYEDVELTIQNMEQMEQSTTVYPKASAQSMNEHKTLVAERIVKPDSFSTNSKVKTHDQEQDEKERVS